MAPLAAWPLAGPTAAWSRPCLPSPGHQRTVCNARPRLQACTASIADWPADARATEVQISCQGLRVLVPGGMHIVHRPQRPPHRAVALEAAAEAHLQQPVSTVSTSVLGSAVWPTSQRQVDGHRPTATAEQLQVHVCVV
jgi:hypothetical protein